MVQFYEVTGETHIRVKNLETKIYFSKPCKVYHYSIRLFDQFELDSLIFAFSKVFNQNEGFNLAKRGEIEQFLMNQ